uniref:Serine/threonine-protein kinase 11-interacting protein n=1 Tax=Astyanax mexicanus TaxID=7994 RepID=A0A8B9LWD4_ASTMX
MPATKGGQSTLVHSLATLLRNNGDSVLDGSSTLTLEVGCVQHLTRLFEQYLLSRTHQHGFLALPSHPADTASLLQVQFLFDMLQKTISLKLINPPGSRLQSVVKIFPFKSLKNLELKRIPPHCLEGLRGVYSQLEVFTCSKSLNSLEELLSLCGGDLSSALPWLELHTLNFSYNSISCLDESLSLLNVLKALDLSHNKIQDCAEFLKPLTELEHLNLAYNSLQRVPALGLNAKVKLVSLILRNNELESINGVEQLSSLQHLDLAYNLLMEHSELAPLSLLHNLSTLTLEGNPLYFKATHRTTTACHLSPRAAFKGVSHCVCVCVCVCKKAQTEIQTCCDVVLTGCVPQALAEVLSRVAEENERLEEEARPGVVRLQCLKCRAEFFRPAAENLPRASSEADGCEGRPGEAESERELRDTVFCPECSSDHVVQLAVQTTPSTSTPVYCGQNGDRCFNFDDTDTPVHPHRPSNLSTLQDVATDSFFTAHSELSDASSNQNEVWVNQTFSSQSAEIQRQSDPEDPEDDPGESARGLLLTQASEHAPFDLLSEDFEAVDHRLKLYLDVEVFDGEEEIRCLLKMSAVRFGDPVEFPSLMVVTDRSIYILEMTSQAGGQPSDWLQKRDSHRLCELRYLEVGLGSQTIHMEFEEGGATAYTLLVRDGARCKRFFSQLTGIARELAPKSDSKLKGISTTRLNPKHHLWPLVCEGSEPIFEDDSHPPFFYLLAFLQQGDSVSSVTVLATREMLCLLDEDHQWSKSHSDPTNGEEGQTSSGRVTVRETQPISCVSSIHLFSSDPCLVDIKLYDEMAKEEKTWPLRAEASQEIQGLVDWVKGQWEAMFGVKLITAVL